MKRVALALLLLLCALALAWWWSGDPLERSLQRLLDHALAGRPYTLKVVRSQDGDVVAVGLYEPDYSNEGAVRALVATLLARRERLQIMRLGDPPRPWSWLLLTPLAALTALVALRRWR